MELGWGGFDRAKLICLYILIGIPFSFHVPRHSCTKATWEGLGTISYM